MRSIIDNLRIRLLMLYECTDYKDEEMIMLLKKLHDCLEREHIQQNQDSSLTKNLILKTVFHLIDSPNEILLLHAVQIILFVSINNSHTQNVAF